VLNDEIFCREMTYNINCSCEQSTAEPCSIENVGSVSCSCWDLPHVTAVEMYPTLQHRCIELLRLLVLTLLVVTESVLLNFLSLLVVYCYIFLIQFYYPN